MPQEHELSPKGREILAKHVQALSSKYSKLSDAEAETRGSTDGLLNWNKPGSATGSAEDNRKGERGREMKNLENKKTPKLLV